MRISTALRLSALLWPVLLWGTRGAAQEPPASQNKTAEIVRSNDVPTIDGVLDEAVWREATLIDDLHQVDPVEFSARRMSSSRRDSR